MAPSRPPSRHFRALMGVPPPAKSGPASSPSFPRQSRSSSPARYVLHQAPAAALRPRRALNLHCAVLVAVCEPPRPRPPLSVSCISLNGAAATAGPQSARQPPPRLAESRDELSLPNAAAAALCTAKAIYAHSGSRTHQTWPHSILMAPHPNRNRDCDHARLRELPVRCRAR